MLTDNRYKCTILVALLFFGNPCIRAFLPSNPIPNDLGCFRDNDTISIDCVTEDTGGQGATIWTGNGSIFNCPSQNSISNLQVFLYHPLQSAAPVFCGNRVWGQIVRQNNSYFTSRLSVQINRQMNGGKILCKLYSNVEQSGELFIKVGVVPPPPQIQSTHFETTPRKQFTFRWTDPKTEGGIGGYIIVNNPHCGVCETNFLYQNYLHCYNWTANGQTCNISIKSFSADCGYYSTRETAKQLILIKPEPPVIKDTIPTYGISKKLETVVISLSLPEGFHDVNQLEVDYTIHLQDNYSNACSKPISRSCNAVNCEEVLELDSDCQTEKNIFGEKLHVYAQAKTPIGHSWSYYSQEIDLRNNIVEVRLVKEQDYFLLITDFVENHKNVSTEIYYGDNFNALNQNKQVNVINDSMACLLLRSNPGAQLFFIATCSVGNSSSSIRIQGSFQGVEIIHQYQLMFILSTMGLALLGTFILFLSLMLLRQRIKGAAVLASDISEAAGESNVALEKVSHNTPNEPVYEEVNEDPNTKINDAYARTR